MRGREKISGTELGKIANPQISIIAKIVATFEYFANFFRSIVLFDDHNNNVWMEIVLQFQFYGDFSDSGQFCLFS